MITIKNKEKLKHYVGFMGLVLSLNLISVCATTINNMEFVRRSNIINTDNMSIARQVLINNVDMRMGSVYLTAKQVDGNKGVKLTWESTDNSPQFYKAYWREKGDSKFTPVSMTDYNSIEQVKVLNVYPYNVSPSSFVQTNEQTTFSTWDGETLTLPTSASLKKWMEEPNKDNPKGYGKGLIEVTPVKIQDFNADPLLYLKNSDGTYKYDVVMFGSWDAYADIDLTSNAVQPVIDYINSGYGVLFGHDFLTNLSPNRWKLASYAKIEVGDRMYNGMNTNSDYPNGSISTIRINKDGLLTRFPWDIGDIDTNLRVPATHTSYQKATGDIWMNFNYNGFGLDDLNNVYLTTNENVAMIQTGHSNGQATEDEQKVIANTLFYLKQLTQNTEIIDYAAVDKASPNIPVATNMLNVGDGIEVNLSAEDKGTIYEHYIYSELINGTGTTTSNITETKVTSGIAGYSYVVDNNATTIPNDTVNLTGGKVVVPKNSGKYLHVKAIDNEGNVSETLHLSIELVKPEPPKIIVSRDGWGYADVTVRIEKQSMQNSDEKIQYKINKGEWNDYAGRELVFTDEGWYVLSARTINDMGLLSEEVVVKFGIDKSAPTAKVRGEVDSSNENLININIKDIVDIHSGVKTVDVSEDKQFSGANSLLNIDIANQTSKDIGYILIDKISSGNHYGDRTIYVRLRDKVGNEVIYTIVVNIPEIFDEKPVIITPSNGSNLLPEETFVVEWEYDIDNPNLKQFILNIYDSNKTITSSNIYKSSTKSTNISLSSGKYELEIVAVSKSGTKVASDRVYIEVSGYRSNGNIMTVDINTGSPMSRILINTKYALPHGSKIEGRVYYKKNNRDTWDRNVYKTFRITPTSSSSDIVYLPGAVSSLKIEYELSRGTDKNKSPEIDEIKVYGR